MRSGALAGVWILVSLLQAGCHGLSPRPVLPTDTPRVHALLINGGGRAGTNYASHVEHLRRMRAVLRDAGVPAERLWILASDGEDPTPDLASRTSMSLADDWMLGGGTVDRALRPQIEHVDTRLPGTRIGRADRAGVTAWFRNVGGALAAGDTLLLFVTDHGKKNAEDTRDNHITLWGSDERLGVTDLRAMIATHLDPNVRVVTIMSQCFSGAFAYLTDLALDVDRPTCGFFSTTADRPAYGCYPEVREENDIGHAVRMARALRTLGALPLAHEATLVWDDSPDVPLRTSDLFLDQFVTGLALGEEKSVAEVADRELARSLDAGGRWERELRLLDDIAAHYGMFSPRRIAEIEQFTAALDGGAESLKRQKRAWSATRTSAANAIVGRFVEAAPDWKARLELSAIRALTIEERADEREALLGAFAPWIRRDDGTHRRIERLHTSTEAASGLAYRTNVRLGVLLRMRYLLIRIAGTSALERYGSPLAQQRFAEIEACEQLRLFPHAVERADVSPPRSALPSLESDAALEAAIRPSWLGVKFSPPPVGLRERHDMAAGAAFINAVVEDSPAAEGGLEAQDVVLGPPGAPFDEPDQLREWTMLHEPDQPTALRVLRDGEPVAVTVRLGLLPAAPPELPAPPTVGEIAPPLHVSEYQGVTPDVLRRPRKTLLFFWATWCAICKAALPDLEKIDAQGDVDVIAITDEAPETVDDFFRAHTGYFPSVVAIDSLRRTFLAYGINGTPNFYMVGTDGRIEDHQVGYRRDKGLAFKRP